MSTYTDHSMYVYMAMAEVPARSIPASDRDALPDGATHGIQRGLVAVVVAEPWPCWVYSQ